MEKTAFAAATLALLLAAVASPAAAADACALLTKAEMEAIAGRPMSAGAPPPAVPPKSPDVTFTQCSWPTADGDNPIGIGVRISKKGDGDPGYARQVAVDSGFKVEDVAGLGDVAFWTGIQLQVFRGKDLQIVVNIMGHRDAKEKAIQVARKALAKL
jgi:hypothetical protein